MEELKNVTFDTPAGTQVLVVRGDKIFKTETEREPQEPAGWQAGGYYSVKLKGLSRNVRIAEVFRLP